MPELQAKPAMIEPIVNVVIPTLGESPYLAEAVESVMSQAFMLWSLLVSPSLPGTKVARTISPYLEDPRVRIVEPTSRMNAAENFNYGVRSGGANYVALLHDDDRWRPEFLARSVSFLDRHPSCGFVYSAALKIDGEGRYLGGETLHRPEGIHGSASILPALYRENFITAPSVVVRRSAYEAIGNGYRDLLFLDHEMWLRLAARFDVGSIAMWQTEYRIHSIQVSSRKRLDFGQARLDLLDAVDDLPVSSSLRRSARAEAHVTCALDHAERGNRRRVGQNLLIALRTSPLALARSRVAGRALAALTATVLGTRAQHRLARSRTRRWQAGGVSS